jgi:hypothetical protein
MVMSVFKKQGGLMDQFYVNAHRKREHIGPGRRPAKMVLRKRKTD